MRSRVYLYAFLYATSTGSGRWDAKTYLALKWVSHWRFSGFSLGNEGVVRFREFIVDFLWSFWKFSKNFLNSFTTSIDYFHFLFLFIFVIFISFHISWFTFHFSLFIFHFSFFIFYFSLFTFHYNLHFLLFTTIYTFHFFLFSLFIFHFLLFIFHFSCLL